MILRLADGYDTQIGDAGTKLSGGQRQRIGLARAVYGNPRLIILDEPNANLDQAGEGALAGAVNELKRRGAAMVIIGHRPSTLAHADKILVLKNGKAEICGPRDAVLQRLRKASVTTTAPANSDPAQRTGPATAPQVGLAPNPMTAQPAPAASRGNVTPSGRSSVPVAVAQE